ncbi:hypothetical protein VCR14J2_30022 [Vibrio coralliirubri]|nr:hypothetical protein VCR14J2_30022 [Vibrio coralliirubri]
MVLFLFVLMGVDVYGSMGSAARAFNSIYFLRFFVFLGLHLDWLSFGER